MSDKCKVIDHVTYERLLETKSSVSTSDVKIRNSKYKRMTSSGGFNLLQFVVKSKDKKSKIRKRRVIDDRFKPSIKKRKGKQRENGLAENPSRLKKSILRYRQMKRDHEKQRQEELHKVTRDLQELTIDHHKETVKNAGKIHSSRFREYCDNCTTPALKQHTENLVRELNRFQRRAYAQNEIKARAHRRFVTGFREVQNFLHINKVKLLVIATDCERCDGEAGLDETISNIKMLCHNQQVPIAFPFQRRQLAYFLYKKSSVSCIGILDYDGARDSFVQLIVALKEAKSLYDQLVNTAIS